MTASTMLYVTGGTKNTRGFRRRQDDEGGEREDNGGG
jgi:hypothetical protein